MTIGLGENGCIADFETENVLNTEEETGSRGGKNAQELGRKRISKSKDSVWKRSDDSKATFVWMGRGAESIPFEKARRSGHLDWSGRFRILDVFRSGEKEIASDILREVSGRVMADTDATGRIVSDEVKIEDETDKLKIALLRKMIKNQALNRSVKTNNTKSTVYGRIKIP